MTRKLRWSMVVLGAALMLAPGWAPPARAQTGQSSSATQDMKRAGRDTKAGAKNAGKATKKGAKSAYRSSKKGTKKAVRKTKNASKGAAKGAKRGANSPQQ